MVFSSRPSPIAFQQISRNSQTRSTARPGATGTGGWERPGRRVPVRRKDADGRTTSYGYDDLDRLAKVTASGGAVTTYGYDKLGNLTKSTDANGHVTAYGYDAVHRLTSVTDPLERKTAYAYDAEGNVTGKTTPRGTTEYTYDPRGLLTKIDYSDATPDATFGYDDAGRLTARANSKISEDFVYDAVGNLTKTRGFAYTCDAAGQMLTRKYSDGDTTTYTYDNDGRTATMLADGKTTTYTWDPAGNLTKSALPNTETEDRTYDRAGRLTAVTSAKAGTTVTKTAHTLSPAGLPTHVDITRANVGTTGYDLTYDTAGRLTSGCFPQPWVAGCAASRATSYTYDKVGNRRVGRRGSSGTISTPPRSPPSLLCRQGRTDNGRITVDFRHCGRFRWKRLSLGGRSWQRAGTHDQARVAFQIASECAEEAGVASL